MKNKQIFSTHNTVKVLQDKRVRDDVKESAVYVKTAKNAFATGQIIVAPHRDVAACTFSLSELRTESGDVFDSGAIEVFYQKYIEVTQISDKETNGQLGWYPDMLLPYDVAVQHGENTVCAQNNQGIIVVFYASAEQPAGTYTGKGTVRMDGDTQEIDVAVCVCDVTLPDIPRADSLFCMEYEFVGRAEKDTSLQMKETYAQELLRYKQTPRLLPAETDSVEDFCKAVRKYYHRVQGFCIPMDVCEYWGAPRYMDYDYLRRNILGLAKICVEDGVNYFVKARNYFVTADEPSQNGKDDAACGTCEKYRQTLEEAAREIENLPVADTELITKKEIADTVRTKVYGIMTNPYTEKIKCVDIWCPPYKSYTDEELHRKYKQSGKPYWGYSCNAQTYPLPNYHIDDMNSFLSARVLGYIMKDYGVTGNLYYETVFFEQVSYKGGLHVEPTDPYTNPMKYPGTNGDGYLFYPGIKYGIKAPIVSNRLLYIRDAVQDYDLLCLLEDAYRARGANPDGLLKSIYVALHSNTEVTVNDERFFEIYGKIFNSIAAAQEGIWYDDIRKVRSEGRRNER